MWIEKTEGAKFWLAILTELRNRGVSDILVLCADGLTALPDAVQAAFPKTVFRTCTVHMARSSTRYVMCKEHEAVCADLKKIYAAHTIEAAELALEEFEAEYALSDDRSRVARPLGDHAVSLVPGRNPPRHLHDQRHRGPQPSAAQSRQNPGLHAHR